MKGDEHTNGPPRPFSSFPYDYHTAMVHASGLSYFCPSQPGSSQFPPDEEAAERAFWQGTPTALEELRQGTNNKCHQAGAFLSRFIVAHYVLTHHTVKSQRIKTDRTIPCLFQHNNPYSFAKHGPRLRALWAAALMAKREHFQV